MSDRNAHCSYCGARFTIEAWPRTCSTCGEISYLNPKPVVVMLVPVDDGLLLVRRAIPPYIGSLALPGGFLEVGEPWEIGGAREVFEETNVRVDAESVEVLRVCSTPNGAQLLIFARTAPLSAADLPTFSPNSEVSEIVIGRPPFDLAFPLHTETAMRFFEDQGR